MEQSNNTISAAARVLADRSADACGVNREDNWKIYSEDFMADAKAALEAANCFAAAPAVDATKFNDLQVHWLAYPGTSTAAQFVKLAEAQPIVAQQAARIVELEALAVQTNATRDVLAERQRQKDREGWTADHDDKYQGEQMRWAAASYTLYSDPENLPAMWPWAPKWWKPVDRRRNLVKAGALLLAEIERMDRACFPIVTQEGK